MKKINVFTHYDSTKTIIGTIRPRDDRTISARTYNKLLKKRMIGGIAGIYTDADFEIKVVNNNGDVVTII